MRGLSRGQLQFTDSPVRLYDPRPSQALRCHVVAAKRRFAAMTHGELTADLVALSPTTNLARRRELPDRPRAQKIWSTWRRCGAATTCGCGQDVVAAAV